MSGKVTTNAKVDVTIPPPRHVFRDCAKIGLAMWNQSFLFYSKLLTNTGGPSTEENEFTVNFNGKDPITPVCDKLTFNGKKVPKTKALVDFTPEVVKDEPAGPVSVKAQVIPKRGVDLEAGIYIADIVDQNDQPIVTGFEITYPLP